MNRKAVVFLILCLYAVKPHAREVAPRLYPDLPMIWWSQAVISSSDTDSSLFHIHPNRARNHQNFSIRQLDSFLTYFRSQQNTAGVGYTLLLLAQFAKQQNRQAEQFYWLHKARIYCEQATSTGENGQQAAMVNWYIQAGTDNADIAKYKIALRYYFSGITELIARHINNKELLATLFALTGSAYLCDNNDSLAIAYLNTAEMLARQQADTLLLSRIVADKAFMYHRNTQFDTAYSLYKVALQYSEAIKDQERTRSISKDLGFSLLQQFRNREAIVYLEKAIHLDPKKVCLPSDSLYFLLGEAYYRSGAYQKAEILLTSAIKKRFEQKDTANLFTPYRILSKVYAATGAFKKAQEYLQISANKYDEVATLRRQESLNDVENRYKTIEKDKKIVQKSFLIAAQSDRLKRKNFWITVLSASALLLTVFLFSLRINSKRKQKIKHLEALMKATENEKSRIAKNLQENISPIIQLAQQNLQTLEQEIDFQSPQQEQQFRKAMQMIDDSYTDVRELSYNIMPRALSETSLKRAIEDLMGTLSLLPLKISLHTQGLERFSGKMVETFIYRLLQECVSNVVQHAQAQHLDILLNKTKKEITITIKDDGQGFDSGDKKNENGMGLKNIAARVQLLRGTITLDTAPNKGTKVNIVIPINDVP